MIDGEAGEAILTRVVALKMDGLVEGDSITCTLIAACVADALRKGQSPRDIAEALWEQMPSDNDWEGRMRERVETAIEEFEEAEAA